MSEDARLEAIHKMLIEQNTTLFGVDQQGGILRELTAVKKRVDDLENSKTRTIGFIAGVSLIFGAISGKLSAISGKLGEIFK